MPNESKRSSELARIDAEANGSELRQLVTPLVPLEQQVGSHVIHALQQPETVAVLTTVMPGPNGSQCIVSIGLNADRMEDVQHLLAQSQLPEEERVPCVGFHCFLPPNDGATNAS